MTLKRFLRILFAGCVLLATQSLRAQYYTWGSDPANLKWSTVRTPDVRIIYPDTVAGVARRTLFYIRSVRPDIAYGFRHGPMRIPFVMHPENFRSNGLVMYLPKRVEFLTAPAVDSYSMPWCKQLVAHEYRHAVQYNNLDRGVIRVLSYILGQQGSTIGLLCMPLWAMEGDAVMTETAMSSYGRGLQPSFSMAYRALGNIGRERRNIDKWFCGSYLTHVPDHYELGYQLCSYAYDKYGENVWDKVAWYGSRNPYVIATTSVALRKFYKTSVSALFRETFDDLDAFWDSLPAVGDSAAPLCELPDGNHTVYRWPLSLPDGRILVLRKDYDRPERFVEIDRASGTERFVAYVGDLSTRPALDAGGRVWWTEYRRSKLFEQRVNSQLCRMDLAERRPRAVAGERRVLYPAPGDGETGWVEYNYDGSYSVVVTGRDASRQRFTAPAGSEIHGLAWDDVTVAWYVLVTDDSGMWIGRIDCEGVHPVTEGAYVTLSDLRAGGGRLYYGSIASGKDEAHCYDLIGRREYRITSSAYGSFDPAPTDSGEVLVTTYGRRGYRPAVQPLTDSTLIPVRHALLPNDVVNPPRRSWPVVNLDTVVFSEADSVLQRERFRTRRYRKAPNLVNVHSWMPVAFDPFAAVDEHVIDVNIGATLLSQNLLSNTEAYVSYGWNRREGSVVRLGARYFGLGVRFDLDATYGGDQVFYSVGQYNEQTGSYEYQKRPSPDKYYSVGLAATLPLYFQCGYHSRQLTLSTGWNYSNGMVADMGRIEWKDGNITNLEHIGFHEGLHKLAFSVGFSDYVRQAQRDFAPRWGYSVSAGYTFNPSDDNFSDLVSTYGRLYLPGFVRHHSLQIAASYQTSLGGYKFPSGYAPLSYRSSRLIPRGFDSGDILSNNYLAAALDYQLPVWYPEGGIGSVLYFKRIRVNVGGDYARFRDYRPASGTGEGRMVRRQIWSVGGDLLFDVNLFRQPASATSTFKLSCYRPSKGGVWVSAAVGLPF
ncbi:MAG: hypothetical protein K2L06_03280 [Alistipes sp.]|nr:hypothetical protein [Alistipes sp.]